MYRSDPWLIRCFPGVKQLHLTGVVSETSSVGQFVEWLRILRGLALLEEIDIVDEYLNAGDWEDISSTIAGMQNVKKVLFSGSTIGDECRQTCIEILSLRTALGLTLAIYGEDEDATGDMNFLESVSSASDKLPQLAHHEKDK